ncbi:MAG: ABC transporter permease [Oscillospiraceae bacterium]|nr:ABC transporter permease [Clostridiales bacterium]MDD6936129.1 ABC transporter permease [Clostridiales bacterium]MDY2962332.1 ABC transporter permease [Oscillospiraceae bacterium]
MSALHALVKRNTKLFFKDKGMFFTSLITPVILLVLYGSFLGGVYEDTFRGVLEGFGAPVSDRLLGGCVGGELASSLLAVCCVTVAFCSNMLMVQDKVSGARHDLTITPVRSGTLALGYYIATLLSTLLVCYVAAGVCLLYLAKVGWYLTGGDVLCLLLDVLLLVLFGTALSSIINHFLSSQGQISAVGTIVSAGYGFLCGAYMPISQFSEGLQKLISFLPGTYGTSLLRNHALRGVFGEMEAQGFPAEAVETIRDAVDCNLYFFGDRVEPGAMYAVLGGAVVVLIAVYVLLNVLRGAKQK